MTNVMLNQSVLLKWRLLLVSLCSSCVMSNIVGDEPYDGIQHTVMSTKAVRERTDNQQSSRQLVHNRNTHWQFNAITHRYALPVVKHAIMGSRQTKALQHAKVMLAG